MWQAIGAAFSNTSHPIVWDSVDLGICSHKLKITYVSSSIERAKCSIYNNKCAQLCLRWFPKFCSIKWHQTSSDLFVLVMKGYKDDNSKFCWCRRMNTVLVIQGELCSVALILAIVQSLDSAISVHGVHFLRSMLFLIMAWHRMDRDVYVYYY